MKNWHLYRIALKLLPKTGEINALEIIASVEHAEHIFDIRSIKAMHINKSKRSAPLKHLRHILNSRNIKTGQINTLEGIAPQNGP